MVKLSASFKKYIASMHRNQSDSQIARKEGLRNDSYADPPSRPPRKQIFLDRYEEGERDEVHVSRTRIRDRRNEYVEEDERPRAQTKRIGKKASRPVEDEDEEEEEEGGKPPAPPTARDKKSIEHSEDED